MLESNLKVEDISVHVAYKLKMEMEQKIAELFAEYSRATGLIVSDIDLDTLRVHGCLPSYMVDVEVKF